MEDRGRENDANPFPVRMKLDGTISVETLHCLPGLAHVISVKNRLVFLYPPTHSPDGP